MYEAGSECTAKVLIMCHIKSVLYVTIIVCYTANALIYIYLLITQLTKYVY